MMHNIKNAVKNKILAIAVKLLNTNAYHYKAVHEEGLKNQLDFGWEYVAEDDGAWRQHIIRRPKDWLYHMGRD